METLTVKYWQRLILGISKGEKKIEKKLSDSDKNVKKLNGKIINYRRNQKHELL